MKASRPLALRLGREDDRAAVRRDGELAFVALGLGGRVGVEPGHQVARLALGEARAVQRLDEQMLRRPSFQWSNWRSGIRS